MLPRVREYGVAASHAAQQELRVTRLAAKTAASISQHLRTRGDT
jgi:hypothetical protein